MFSDASNSSDSNIDSEINYSIGPSRKIRKTNYLVIFAVAIVLIIVAICVIHNVSLNKTSDVQDVIILNDPTKETLQEKIKGRLPIIINGMIVKDDLLYELTPYELRDGNPNYLLKSPEKIYSFADFIAERRFIYNDPKFVKDFKMDFRVDCLLYGFKLGIRCCEKSLFSMFISKNKLLQEYNRNNVCVILQLNGTQTINLFHPEYSEDIKSLGDKIWSEKSDDINESLVNVRYLQLEIKAGQILYIPPLWRWCSIVTENCVYVKYTCDSYFTTIVNRIK
jgi:hypothetical protein